jgi:hypothetical protein
MVVMLILMIMTWRTTDSYDSQLRDYSIYGSSIYPTTILYLPLAFPPIVSNFSDSNSVSIYILIHYDFDDLMRLRMLQLMVLISCVFSVCHLIIIDVKMYYVTCLVSCKSSSF